MVAIESRCLLRIAILVQRPHAVLSSLSLPDTGRLPHLNILTILFTILSRPFNLLSPMAFLRFEIFLGVLCSAWLGILIYRAAFAPLSKLPGPWYSLFSDAFLMYREFSAQRRVYIHELHKTYGPVVRLGPNEVSFTSLEALKEIYQSGGSGYDKTEFYNLFIQYGIR